MTFNKDLKFSQDDLFPFEGAYEIAYPDLLWVEDVTDMRLQRQGVDKLLHLERGKVISVDEKLRREEFNDVFIERWSSEEHQKPGWAFRDDQCCDLIAYGVIPTGRCLLLPTLQLRLALRTHSEAWWKAAVAERDGFKAIWKANAGYTTVGMAVPQRTLLDSIAEACVIHGGTA